MIFFGQHNVMLKEQRKKFFVFHYIIIVGKEVRKERERTEKKEKERNEKKENI